MKRDEAAVAPLNTAAKFVKELIVTFGHRNFEILTYEVLPANYGNKKKDKVPTKITKERKADIHLIPFSWLSDFSLADPSQLFAFIRVIREQVLSYFTTPRLEVP